MKNGLFVVRLTSSVGANFYLTHRGTWTQGRKYARECSKEEANAATKLAKRQSFVRQSYCTVEILPA